MGISIAMGWLWVFRLLCAGYGYFDCYKLAMYISIAMGWLWVFRLCFAMVILIAMGWLWVFRLLWDGYGYFNCALLWVFFAMCLSKYNSPLNKKICPLNATRFWKLLIAMV
jgi:hypothetical protein